MLQEDEYYSFGLRKSLYDNSNNNRYLYNGKEVQTDLKDQYDYGARFYDPVIGRWGSIDKYAEKYDNITPYGYVANDPIKQIDANGDTIIKVNIIDESGFIHGATSIYIDKTFYNDVKTILADAAAGTNIHINSSFRTNADQAGFTNDNATTPAPPGKSAHNAGLALDFNLYNDNDVTKGIIPKNKTVTNSTEFIKDVKKDAGVRWGGNFKHPKPDPIHLDKRGDDKTFKKLRDEDQQQMHGDTEKENNDKYIESTINLYVLPPNNNDF